MQFAYGDGFERSRRRIEMPVVFVKAGGGFPAFDCVVGAYPAIGFCGDGFERSRQHIEALAADTAKADSSTAHPVVASRSLR